MRVLVQRWASSEDQNHSTGYSLHRNVVDKSRYVYLDRKAREASRTYTRSVYGGYVACRKPYSCTYSKPYWAELPDADPRVAKLDKSQHGIRIKTGKPPEKSTRMQEEYQRERDAQDLEDRQRNGLIWLLRNSGMTFVAIGKMVGISSKRVLKIYYRVERSLKFVENWGCVYCTMEGKRYRGECQEPWNHTKRGV